jgi:hypothetical protein
VKEWQFKPRRATHKKTRKHPPISIRDFFDAIQQLNDFAALPLTA